MAIALIDADSIIYKAGFAVETKTFEVVGETEDGMVSGTFDDTTTAGEFIHAMGMDPFTAEITVSREAEPVENAIQIVKTMLRGVMAECPGVDGKVVFLSGKDNYRDKIGTIKPYKGNRDKAHKPIHFKAMRSYLIYEHYAVLSCGNEADDEVAIEAALLADEPHVIVHIDKDLDQIPGLHWNYTSKEYYEVSEEDALAHFYKQILSGDTSDNVGGCYRVGEAGAARIVASQIEHEGFLDEEHMWQLIVSHYEASQKKKGCPYADKDPAAVALENAQLVYLQQKPGELWLPNGERGTL